MRATQAFNGLNDACDLQSQIFVTLHIFCKHLAPGLSPEICLYFQGFRGSKFLNGCLVI